MGSQVKKQKSYSFKLTVTLLHLAFWAELGVLTRVFLDKFLDLGCDGDWGACLEGGIYFKDLVSNLLGSFIIGVFAASSTCGLQNDKPLALLPKKHSWQANFELQLGIRTGYCGSLTTFASWQLEVMVNAINKNQWVNMLVAYFVAFYACIASYIVGMHIALYTDRWLLPEREREDVLHSQATYREQELSVLRGQLPPEELPERLPSTQAVADVHEWEPDIPINVPSVASMRRRRRPAAPLSRQSAPAALDDTPVPGLTHRPRPSRTSSHPAGGGIGRSAPRASTLHSAKPLRVLEEGMGEEEKRENSGAEAAAVAGAAAAAAAASYAEEGHKWRGENGRRKASFDGIAAIQGLGQEMQNKVKAAGDQMLAAGGDVREVAVTFMGNKTDFCVLLGLLGATVALAVGAGLETQHKWLRQIWVECLFGPFGCALRWYLSRFNYTLVGRWAWFPIGTFVANMLGTFIDFALQCVLQRKKDLSYWGAILIPAVQTGFCGALTTVSTFVTEIVKFAELFPETVNAYAYTLYSLGGGMLLGVAVYGWSVWAT